MINYTQEEIRGIIAELFGERKLSIAPIGNHELNRNLVYRVTDDIGLSQVVKLYYKKNRWNREVATMSQLKDSDILVPKLIDYGVLKDGVEWCIMEYLEGIPLVEMFNRLSSGEKVFILEEMGAVLGTLHSFSFKYFGNWDEKGNSLERAVDYPSILIDKIESNMLTLFQQRLPEVELQKRALEKLRGYYDLFDEVKTPRLCHNDFDGRNVLINRRGDKWTLASVIDFEQSYPWDSEHDLKNMYHTIFLDLPELEEAFLKSYQRFHRLSESFNMKMKAYLLYLGLNICSWSYMQAPDYYRQGIELLERLVGGRI